ncbi:MAG: glutamine--tRNA ligase/YqeY domain fusion protein [Granulosicoccus sp.]
MNKPEPVEASNFIRNMIEADVAAGKHDGQVVTRFPPEPNGYLHIGHAKSICLNFGMAARFNGRCNLRFDDTNPVRESEEYALAIKDDVSWLGFEWSELRHASDYFEQLYQFARELIRQDKAYVDSSSAEELRTLRGTLTEPGTPSEYRARSVAENMDLFQRMRDGEFADGAHVLRAKIDLASGNMNMRDPTLYRIRKVSHIRTGDSWPIYPMYDYTHCVSDAIEKVTHSLCTLEFEDHRPLYNWVLEQLDTGGSPEQTEFARLSLEYTVLSKRRLIQLVEEKHVRAWDDPRMPTITAIRRRGYTPSSLRNFCELIGVTKNDAWIEMVILENCIRDQLNVDAPRRMAVLDPIKVIITDLDEDYEETLSFANHPQNESFGRRDIPFSRELWIDRDDFAEVPPPKYQRLVPGGEVRLRGSYVIKCNDITKDHNGNIVALHCTHDPQTLGKKPEGRKVKGVIHWVCANKGVEAEVRLYEPLFTVPDPASAESFSSVINSNSETVLNHCVVEPLLADTAPEMHFQFERLGYFVTDRRDHSKERPVFNRTVTLRDTWAK